ncbi:50S ribosomal protein L28 [Patulibacter sp. S7RM1-6]
MSQVCQVTGARPRTGNNVPHSQHRTKRWFRANVHKKRYFVPSENRWITLRVSARGQKVIDARGIDRVVKDLRARGERF